MKKALFVLSFFLIIYTPYIVHAETPYNIIENIEKTEGVDVGKIANQVLSGEMPIGFFDIMKKIAEIFVSGIKENIPSIIKMSAILVLSGLILNLSGQKNETGTFATVAIVSLIAVKTFSYVVSETEETINSLFIFIQALMTPVATAVSAGGAASGAACGSVFVSMQVFIHICKSVFLPLICVITAFSVGDKLGEHPYLEGINNLLKQFLKWGTGLMITIYGVVIALQTQTAQNLDTLAGKSIKYAVGSFMPVVGGALSDSLETVIASAKTISGALGVAGIIGIGYICIVPLLNVCAVCVSFKLAAAIGTVGADTRVRTAINEIGDSIGKVAVLLISVAVMFIISLAMLMNMGGAL